MGEIHDHRDASEGRKPTPVSHAGHDDGEARVRASPGSAVSSMSPEAVLRLSSAAGNAAVQRLLGRSRDPRAPRLARGSVGGGTATVVQRKVDPTTAAQMIKLEAYLDGVSTNAGNRSQSLNAISDNCLAMLKEANQHLDTSGKNYKAARTAFDGVLKKADSSYETEKAVYDSVQGILIAIAVSFLAPEALAAAGVLGGMRLLATSSSATARNLVLRLPLERIVPALEAPAGAVAAVGTAIGEGTEQVAGKGVDAAKGDGAKPSETSAAAGDTAGDKYEEAFTRMKTLIDAIPALGASASAATQLAIAASALTKQAAKIQGGLEANIDAAELEYRTTGAMSTDDAAVTVLKQANDQQARVKAIRDAIMEAPLETADQIERRLWTRWMASLGDKHDMLDIDAIEDYLGPKDKNMLDFGLVTFSWDEKARVEQAQKDWMREMGVDPEEGKGAAAVQTRFKGAQAMDLVRKDLLGKTAKAGGGVADVAGRSFSLQWTETPGPGVAEGRVVGMTLKPGLFAQWTDNEFVVKLKPILPPSQPEPGADIPLMPPKQGALTPPRLVLKPMSPPTVP